MLSPEQESALVSEMLQDFMYLEKCHGFSAQLKTFTLCILKKFFFKGWTIASVWQGPNVC